MTSSQDAAALVAGSPFAERLARGAPTIVAAGRPARVLFANPAALALFAARDARRAGGRRSSPLRALARGACGISPRRCGGRSAAGGIAALLGRPAAAAARRCCAAGSPRPAGFPRQRRRRPANELRAGRCRTAASRSARRRRGVFSGVSTAKSVSAPSTPRSRPPSATTRPQAGETLATFSARAGFDRDGELADALAARRTFSALPIELGRRRRRARGVDVGRAGIRSRPALRRISRIRTVRRSDGAGRASRAAPPRPRRAAAGRSRG